MTDSLIRVWYMLRQGSRPIDWVVLIVDFLVLAITARAYYTERKDKKRLEKLVSDLTPLQEKGQRLRVNTPRPGPNPDRVLVAEWSRQIENWTAETLDLLTLLYPRAVPTFDTIDSLPVVTPTYSRTIRGNQGPFCIHGPQLESYTVLEIRLKNLRQIVETPEAYV